MDLILFAILWAALALLIWLFFGTDTPEMRWSQSDMRRREARSSLPRTPGLARKRKINTTSLFAEATITGLAIGKLGHTNDSTGR
jgi:hypothetical protein